MVLVTVQLLPPGVHVCMDGRVFAAGTVRKDRAGGASSSAPRPR